MLETKKIYKSTCFATLSVPRFLDPDKIFTKRKVTVYGSKPGYGKAPFFYCPEEDTVRREFVIGSELTEELLEKSKSKASTLGDKEKYAIKVWEAAQKFFNLKDPNNLESVGISNGKVLDLSIPQDAGIYLLLSLKSNISPDKMSVNKDQHRYFIEDSVEEAKNVKDKFELMQEAGSIIKGIEINDYNPWHQMLYGFAPSNNNADTIIGKLYAKAQEDPASVIKIHKDPNLDKKLLIYKAIELRIFNYNKTKGEFYNETYRLGRNIDDVIDYLNLPANAGMYDILLTKCYPDRVAK